MGDDGHFEIAVSCEKQPGNWLPMEPDTSSLIVRQTFRDRANEQIAELQIERFDSDGPPPALTPEFLDRAARRRAARPRQSRSACRHQSATSAAASR